VRETSAPSSDAMRYRSPYTTRRLTAETAPLHRAATTNGAAAAPAAWLVFEVSDTGPGIAAEDLPHIFDRFYRTDRARTRETGGSGLGLAIVERLVQAQHGQVNVHSAVGRGSTFGVWLPAAPRTVAVKV
jgi:signal transduction histidine kinase